MAARGKCTFGARIPINFNFLNEEIPRENKYYVVFKTYTPHFGRQPLTTKFYARHEKCEFEDPSLADHIEHYIIHIKNSRMNGPTFKYPMAKTGNQEYGWYHDNIFHDRDRNDKRFYYPLKSDSQAMLIRDLIADATRRRQEAKGLH